MTKTKALSKAMLVGTAFTVGASALITPTMAKDYLSDGKQSLTMPPTSDTEGVFNSRDKDRASWYMEKGQNRVYKTYRNYFYFYSPVRPRDVKKGLADYSGLYENWLTRKTGQVGAWDTRHLLVSTNPTNSKYNLNFKTKAIPIQRIRDSKGGNTYVESTNVDKYGQFAGMNGEWRYLGYGADGSSVGNGFFPADYQSNYNALSYNYVVKPWNTQGWAKTFVPGSSYDSATASSTNAAVKKRYEQKLRAVNLLREQSPTMKKKSTAWWMDRLSLMSDPINDSAQFRAAWTPYGQGRYVESVLINEKEQRNLMITEMIVRNSETGAVVAKFNRSKAGVEKGVQTYFGDKKLYTGVAYDIEAKVKNLSNKETALSETELEIGYKKNYNANVDYPSDFKGANGNEYNQMLTGKPIPAKGTKSFTLRDVVIPEDARDTTLRFSSLVGAGHRQVQDNLNTDDDIGVLPIQVVGKGGDVELGNIQLINESGKAVANPVPGEKYKIRYHYTYSGADVRYPTYRTRSDDKGNTWSEFAGYVYPTVPVSVTSTINRTLPGKVGQSIPGDVIRETMTQNSQVRNGQKFTFTTPEYHVYETPKIKAQGDFNIGGGYEGYNSVGGNDAGSKEWNREYDYSIENLQVVPRTERSPVDGRLNVAVSFTAVQDLPEEAEKAGFEQAVDMAVEIDGKTHYITEHLTAGKNKNITFETTVDAKIGQVIHATAMVNDTAQAWETDLLTQSNNKASTGFISGLVTSANHYSNDLNANTAGFLTNAMLFPTDEAWESNTKNEWTQTYEIHDITGEPVSYKTGATTNRFFKYRNESVEEKDVRQEESYQIQEVLFKSKYTKDNEMGDNKDGWVNMETAENLPRIKAGYGYELKVTVKYDTNALETQPERTLIPSFGNRNERTGNATLVRPYHTAPNIPDDLFVKTSDGKILSVSGARGTMKGLEPDANNGKDGVYSYTLKASNPFGVKEQGKIYVGEDVKDGQYGLEVWTPVINGIPTKNAEELPNGNIQYTPSQLADHLQLQFEVKGSATDDLVDTIIQ